MDKLQDYIKPELLVLIPVLYILGLMLKKTEKINDKYIPVMLGIIGIVLSAIYVAAVSGICLMSVFTAVTQGILVAGAAVYVNQLVKQNKE
ncbi:MAG: phage holin family protein [Coprococcus sp.]|jgi:hypothetical protein|nr:MAG TPA: holin [Caudoviricetes sp.]